MKRRIKREERKKGRRKEKGGEKKGGEKKRRKKNASPGIKPRTFRMEGHNSNPGSIACTYYTDIYHKSQLT